MDVAEHLSKASHNWQFLQGLDYTKDAFADWHVVILSYAALHLADCLLLLNGEDQSASHVRRNRGLERLTTTGVLPVERLADYLRLLTRSRLLRYEELGTTAGEFTQLLTTTFRNFEAEVLKSLPAERLSPLSVEG